MPPAVPHEAADDGGDDEDPDPAADAQPGADAVPDEDPDQQLREDAGLREADSARSDAAAGGLQAELLASLLRRLRFGRLARALVEQIVVLRHQPLTFFSSSSSSRSFLFTRFGTSMRTRA